MDDFNVQDKTILVQFTGGPRDMQVISSDSANEFDMMEAYNVLVSSKGGTVGREVGVMSPAGIKLISRKRCDKAPQRHIYEVTERAESTNAILILVRYIRAEAGFD